MSEDDKTSQPFEDSESELWFLRWFYQECDFGPGDDDVREAMKDEFKSKYGPLPKGYECE